MKRRAEARTVEDLPAHLRSGARPADRDSHRQWIHDRRAWCAENGVSMLTLLIHEKEQRHRERYGNGAA